MADDSVIPNIEAKEIESKEANYDVVTGDVDTIISDVEIDTVLNFISSPSPNQLPIDNSPHFISSIANVSSAVEPISESSNFAEEINLKADDNILIFSSPHLSSDSLETTGGEIDVADVVIDVESAAEISLEELNEPVKELIINGNLNSEAGINQVTEDSKSESIPISETLEAGINQVTEDSESKSIPISETTEAGINQVAEDSKSESIPISETLEAGINQVAEDSKSESIPISETLEAGINQVAEDSKSKSIPISEDVKPDIKPVVAETSETNDLVTSLNGIITDDTPEAIVAPANHNIQVKFHHEPERLVITLPGESQSSNIEYTWSEIWQQLKQRLNAGDRFRVANTNVHLVVGDRLLDARQLQELAESLSEVQLHLRSVSTSRRQTAIASVTAGYSVEQNKLTPKNLLSADSSTNVSPLSEPLYMETTIRSGVEIRHPGTVTILGDVNPGGTIIADGDILIWGRLRGIAHAGARGNSECLIMALQMEPTQLRIADAVARAPEKPPKHVNPEVAHITPQGIRIVKASDFSRNKVNPTP